MRESGSVQSTQRGRNYLVRVRVRVRVRARVGLTLTLTITLMLTLTLNLTRNYPRPARCRRPAGALRRL